MTPGLTIECDVHFERKPKGRKELQTGREPESTVAPGRIPRVARLMALAIRFEQLLQNGDVASYTELAELGQVTRARVSQVMNLLQLAPDIQEAVLFLPRTMSGRHPIQLYHLQPIAAVLEWKKQRKLWEALLVRVES